MEIGVLGELAIVRGGRPVALTSSKQRNILAVLLSRANRATTDGGLAAAVWGQSPPSAATVRWHVHHVRQALGDDRIARRDEAYILLLDPAELDAARFERLLALAREQRAPEAAAAVYGEALALWRGDAYAGLDAVSGEAARLEELRLAAAEERAQRLLALDRPAEAAAELAPLVAAHPLREGLRAAHVLALHRSGRRAEALSSYREGRSRLVAELGVEPGRHLRAAHAQALNGDPPHAWHGDPPHAWAGDPPNACHGDPPHASRGDARPSSVQALSGDPWPSPAQLPPDVVAFTGRRPELAALDRALETGAAAVVTGPAGVGKTGLALRWAHTRAVRFPDGQLAADLRAGTGPVPPAEVLARFLRALGVTDVPGGLDERAALYRTLLRHRRVLVVLDDAACAAQVRPLLPGAPGCRVLVTGRGRFEGLVGEGATPMRLDVLPRDQAVSLLQRLVPAPSVDEDTVLPRIAELCDGLPLALRAAAARLATRPGWTAGLLAGRMRAEHSRLDELRAGDLDVRAAIATGYEAVGERERLLLCLLGLLPAAVECTPWLVTVMLGAGLEEAGGLLDRLADQELLRHERADEQGWERYRMHALVRLFAAERAAAEVPARLRDQAVARAMASPMGRRRPNSAKLCVV
ncbi:BTAD domain-containing putative transcriptional regulator [Nonomuraea sp. NPDC050790]|uniref:AfsR/SARP family transcriptional regulator n=1 Tax=Nonomuraea sp. NPDC050790 TaxID=3364371 RepID=UPI0037BBBB73